MKALRAVRRAFLMAAAIVLCAWPLHAMAQDDPCGSTDASAKPGMACMQSGLRRLEAGDAARGWNDLMRACRGHDEGAACRQLDRLLAAGRVQPSWKQEVEHALIESCRADALPESPSGVDVRWRVCWDMGRYFAQRADGGDDNARTVAAYMFKRACELGHENSCGLLLGTCLTVNDDVCQAIPTRDDARRWADERRQREHAVRVKSGGSSP